MDKLSYPVIVIPGITGSYLRDEYPIDPESVWSVLGITINSIAPGLGGGNKFERISLHPDNLRYESLQPARIQSDRVFDIAYRELILELRHNLSYTSDQPVPVYAFAYDWRQPLELIIPQLDAFVEEVIDRTKLLRHYHDKHYGEDNEQKVNLIGHSLGGLIITRYLIAYGMKKRVHKVATLATPFRGSFETAIKLATGTSDLGTGSVSSREREAARVTPSLYQILPTCPTLEVDPGIPADVFDPNFWQDGIIKTITEYVRLHAVLEEHKQDPGGRAQEIFKDLLDKGRQHQAIIDKFNLASVNLEAKDWLCVVGVNVTTRVGLKVTKNTEGIPSFLLSSDERMNFWGPAASASLSEKKQIIKSLSKDPQQRRRTGDGTVPFESAVPPFLALENLVCVTPDDFGYFEFQDRFFAGQAGFHGILPNMDMLHRLIVRHFRDDPDQYCNTWGRCPPGVDYENWQTPFGLKSLRQEDDLKIA